MKKPNSYDIFCLIFATALALTVGAHISEGDRRTEKTNIIITAELHGDKPLPDLMPGAECLIDGKYPSRIASVGNGYITLLAEGSLEEAGFLICGTKYVALRQPLKLYADGSLYEGRISKINQE